MKFSKIFFELVCLIATISIGAFLTVGIEYRFNFEVILGIAVAVSNIILSKVLLRKIAVETIE